MRRVAVQRGARRKGEVIASEMHTVRMRMLSEEEMEG